MKKYFFILLLFVTQKNTAQNTIIKYLSGTDKDHTVLWDFMCTTGMNSGKWSKIAVPSCWEQQGFGTFNYYQDTNNPEEKGFYKYFFKSEKIWKGKNIFIVFQGSMTDTEVMIDGQIVGPVHQGSFYEFKYDISKILNKTDVHLLEVKVEKKSSNISVNRAERQADFWMFGGIFRPVFLQILPSTFIERVAIDAKANGNFNCQVFTNNTQKEQRIEVQIIQLNGEKVGKAFSIQATDSSLIKNNIKYIKDWNPEDPNLYKARISVKEGNKVIHCITQRFGFRTIEFKYNDGFYLNDVKIIFKGVCRHSQWPESGRTLSRKIHLIDIGLIKNMNMNAVRMSHYPPDTEFLDLCDSLGLFVLDELTGWQKAYDTIVGKKLIKELVVRDVNHPSIVIWDNGNEGGWNRALDGDYDQFDLQKRHVIHPWERFDGTNTKHYPDYKYIQNEVANPKEVFFPTEFMHGLFDGGQAAGLDDMWKEMMKHPYAAGAFLWSFHDEGVVRVDKHDSIDVAGNGAPDGILGPHREKEASFYSIKEIWSPIYINSDSFKVNRNYINIENRFLFTNLNKCVFKWKVTSFSKPGEAELKYIKQFTGTIKSPSLKPGQKGILKFPIPTGDVFYIIALDLKGDTICTWSWPLIQPIDVVKKHFKTNNKVDIHLKEDKETLSIKDENILYQFDIKNGFLSKIITGNKTVSLNGPTYAGKNQYIKTFQITQESGKYNLSISYIGDSLHVVWTFQNGRLPQMKYSYIPEDSSDYCGITFNYPEEKITGIKWMGKGPYRVWKNRIKGQQFGVWNKKYNNTVTGQNWIYPEFKGWHSDLYWVQFQNTESNFIIYIDQPKIYLQILNPEKPIAANNNNTSPGFPPGTFGFMHAISPIGTKFQKADLMGPQSEKNRVSLGSRFEGTLYFDFR